MNRPDHGRQPPIEKSTLLYSTLDACKRQVTPRDHQRKLKPETVARLNEIFADDLREFGFPVDVSFPA